jgi:PPOX class probable FMN-dependent enzyme
MSEYEITSVEELRAIYPPPAERAIRKQLDHLDHHCRRFIALSPFVLLATASAGGACDVSPKGGPPGFARVLDDTHLLIADATGNRRLDGLENIIENPQVGLVFLIPGMRETLRVNGGVRLSRHPQLLADAATGGRPAQLALIVEVREAYLHCAKALIRSALWDTSTWLADAELPSAAEILSDHTGLNDLAASAAVLEESYTNRI